MMKDHGMKALIGLTSVVGVAIVAMFVMLLGMDAKRTTNFAAGARDRQELREDFTRLTEEQNVILRRMETKLDTALSHDH